MKKLKIVLIVGLMFMSHCRNSKDEGSFVLSTPAGNQFTSIHSNNRAVLPNGRLVTPLGRQVRVAPHPYGLVLSQDGKTLITANSGTYPFSLSIITDLDKEAMTVRQIPEPGQSGKGILETVFMGLAVAPDHRTLYASSGGGGEILVFDLTTGQRVSLINLNGTFSDGTFKDGYIGELVLDRQGSRLYAVDQANFRMVVVDVQKGVVLSNVRVGRYPFGIALSRDESKAFVANVGMFEYSTVEGFDAKNPEETTLTFPPFGFPSEQAVNGTVSEGKQVPGLGDPNASESFSVWVVDVTKPGPLRVIDKIKTGHLVGEPLEKCEAVGGSGPNSIAVTDEHVFVSNGNNDCITVLDAKTHQKIKDIDLYLHPTLQHLRGVIPFGLCVDQQRQRLYVAESGINAIGVIDTRALKFLGHMPAGWFPSKLALSADGRTLYVANAKGLGAGPNAGANHSPHDPTNVGHLMRGLVSLIPLSSDRSLAELSEKVVANNVVRKRRIEESRSAQHPVPPLSGGQSPIRHIVYITKENRTYDEVYGALGRGNGDSSLSIYGVPRSFTNPKTGQTVNGALAMPNHIALADRFALCDNFYCDSDHSADGHRWLVNTYPNEWVETSTTAHYGKGKRHQSAEAPGRLGFTGASGAIYPEDYNEAGAIWEHMQRHGIRFYNYGLGFEFAASFEEQRDKYTGIRIAANYPMPQPLFENTSRRFATFNMNIPDQFRVDMFEEEYRERWLSGKEPFPQVITMMLPNDHAADPRPQDGFPFHASFMSDNDLAVGRVIELLTHSPFWPHMAIFITEDDAQGGLDHVDAHRSLCLVISPYAKRGHISSVHTSIVSIMKTMFLILNVPPVNLYDACASDLSDCFSEEAVNLEPYNALPVDPRLFDPQKALDPFDKEFNWKNVNNTPELDNPALLRFEREEKYRDYVKQQKR